MHTLETVFTFENLLKAGNKALRGVRWKASSQRFENNMLLVCADLSDKIHNKTYKQKPAKHFTISERGKTREISALHITDRVVQKCFCDNFLTPLLTPKLIYDTGACLVDRGVSFSRNRIKCFLERFLRKNDTGYILCVDFKKYFNSISHEVLLKKMRKLIKNNDLYALYENWIKTFKGDKGLGLGSQISQISATYYANDIDQYIKHNLKIKHYIRYMDDCILIHKDKEYLKHCLRKIEEIAVHLKIELNNAKTKIVKLSKGFVFLKRKYIINGKKIVQIPLTDTFKRMRRKIGSNMNGKDLRESFISWKASLKNSKCHRGLCDIEFRINNRKH